MTKVTQGIVRGQTIELAEDLGLAEGQQVEVQVNIILPPINEWGGGVLRTAGALADDPDWDGIMDEIHPSQSA